MATITQEELKRVLYYRRETGEFFWRFGTRNRLPWRKAGTINGAGYSVIGVRGQVFYAHRLAVLYVDGAMPPQHTDHKNGARGSNAIENLRSATFSQNGLNRKAANKNSVSGIAGVSKRRNRFRARVMVDRVEISLGSFVTQLEAIRAVTVFKAKQFEK